MTDRVTELGGYTPEKLEFVSWLIANGMRNVKLLPGNRWAATQKMMFTHAIMTGPMFDRATITERWCFSNAAKAADALDAWDGTGEPQGWHRHPSTGRRRVEGDIATEYVEL